ncbi:RNA polymerase factor sigma-54 [Microvirga lotononidis]|uniref:RNA polymerase sigma-54 factor n=1 Tax=Microvirga lotononidis TaxID=864069 RepID=I4YZ93_9HYPH|nr:RNA polymerase factor sigma-54 [Microvirga lotononidis]EIM29285.1 RNA polymerase sigma-54 factor [Microvirga lotononidis]WQO29112.1 RNA polymerase factor sigma-54 [Microvirga lotononidis]
MNTMQRLELRHGQSLTMTPQLVQSIKLLQLSHAELAAYVEAELERNPLLQEGEAPGDAPIPSLADFLRAKQKADAAGPRIVPGPPPSRSEAVSTSAGQASAAAHSELNPEWGERLARAASLSEHLEAQLDLATADPKLRLIGEHLIRNLDEAGYLSEDLAELAARLRVTPEEVEGALRLIQSFEPSGVGARNLAECLAIQLRERDRLDPAMQALLSHLHLVARRDFAALRKVCGVDQEDLVDMLAEIRRLEPKPGQAFAAAAIDVLVPDVLVRTAPDGSLHVELNPDTLPRILLNRSYYTEVAKVVRKDEDRSFLSDCLQTASWLTRSLDQRAKTILKVAAEIVSQQEAFFRQGVSALRPMTLRSVAEAIGMHESTISRVAANKAIGTERGTHPMKFFFSAATGEGEHSARAVRHRVRQLIAAEGPDDVLSDEAIAQRLRSDGIQVARRTVAKYRESLRIPSSADRRRKNRIKT